MFKQLFILTLALLSVGGIRVDDKDHTGSKKSEKNQRFRRLEGNKNRGDKSEYFKIKLTDFEKQRSERWRSYEADRMRLRGNYYQGDGVKPGFEVPYRNKDIDDSANRVKKRENACRDSKKPCDGIPDLGSGPGGHLWDIPQAMVKSTPRTPVRGPQWCSATRSPYAGKVGFGLPEVNKNLMKTSKNVKSKVSSGMSRAMVLKQKTTVKPTTRKIVLQRQTTVKMITTPRPARIPIIKQKKPSTSSMQLQLVLTAEQQQQLNDDAGEENVGRLSTTKTPTKIVCVTPISKQNRSEGENASAGGPQMQLLLTPLQKQFYDGSVPRDDDPMDDEGESTIATPSTCPEVREVENRLSCLADRARSNGANCTPHSRKSIGLDEMEKRMSSIKNMKSSDKDCLVCAPPLVSPFTYQPSEMDSQPENSLMRFSIRSTKARMSSSPQQSSPTGSDVIMRDADDNISLPETVHEIEVSQSPYVTRMSLRGIQPSPDEESNIVVSSTPNLVSRLSVNPTSDRKSVVFRSPADESSVSIATPMMRLSYEEGSLVGNVSKPPLREMTYRELQLCAKGLGIAASGKMRTLLTRINRYQNSVQ